jgi:CDP-glycerol glycerophosphotransferase (TagB/SpsB family)
MWKSIIEYSRNREGTAFLGEANADLQEIMVAADVLITDFSSAAEEFLVFNKPLVFANHLSPNGYHLTRGEWDEIHSCGQVVTQKEELQRALGNALNRPQDYEAQRIKMRDYVYFQVDGHAAERAAQALRGLLET